MIGNKRDRLVSWALGAIAGISIGLAIIDVLNIAPGWAARLTPLFVGVLLLYVVLERERVESIKFIVRRLDRGVDQLRGDLRKTGSRRSKAAEDTSPPAGRGDTYRSIAWKGMIFRSNTEVRIAKALDNSGVFYIPPTKARFSMGKERTSREIDFMVFDRDRWGVLEVDGPYHHADADAARDEVLRGNGIRSIQRFSAEECYTDPQNVVRQFLARLHGDA